MKKFLFADVTKLEDIKSAAKMVENAVGEEGLTFLINNAGLAKPLPFPDLTQENMNLHFNTNAVGPTMVFQVISTYGGFTPLLQERHATPATKHFQRNQWEASKTIAG